MSSTPPATSPKVLFATPECAPLVKTGGLGDVSAALPAALLAAGIDVRVLLPGYLAVLAASPEAPEAGRMTVLGHEARLLESKLPNGVPLFILDVPSLYARGGGPYQADDGDDWEDNAIRFGVLSKAAAMLGSSQSPLAWRPDVVHCNDWPTAMAPAYLQFSPQPHAASLTTIHNLAFQGVFEMGEMAGLGLPPQALGMEGIEFYGKASFLKAGLVYSEAINTVSPTYAREIQTPELGFGMDGILRHRSSALHGVLNGIDTSLWNPATDPMIAARFSALTLEKKLANKLALKKRVGLAGKSDVPLLAMVTRLTHQKGVDLAIQACDALLAAGSQMVFVGTGDADLVERLRALQARKPGNVAVFIGFDEGLAHEVEAGADIFLMPSRFEPCGMNQMYSQRYGTPPVANATGGLVDTITDDASPRPTGFLMKSASVEALVESATRAISAYKDPKRWRGLQLNGMARDFGWSSAARQYIEIYRKIIGVRLQLS